MESVFKRGRLVVTSCSRLYPWVTKRCSIARPGHTHLTSARWILGCVKLGRIYEADPSQLSKRSFRKGTSRPRICLLRFFLFGSLTPDFSGARIGQIHMPSLPHHVVLRRGLGGIISVFSRGMCCWTPPPLHKYTQGSKRNMNYRAVLAPWCYTVVYGI